MCALQKDSGNNHGRLFLTMRFVAFAGFRSVAKVRASSAAASASQLSNHDCFLKKILLPTRACIDILKPDDNTIVLTTQRKKVPPACVCVCLCVVTRSLTSANIGDIAV